MTLLASVEMIDPEMAAKYLETMGRNRNVNRRRIEYLNGVHERGEWQMTSDAIAFDTNGALINGQHRLLSIIQSEVTVPCLVVRGLDPHAFTVLDTGLKRSAAQSLAITGFVSSGTLAAVIRLVLMYDRHHMASGLVLSNDEYIRFAERHRNELDRAVRVGRTIAKHVGATATSLGTFEYIASREHGIEDSDRFLDAVKTGANLSKGDPRLAVRNYLNNRNVIMQEKARAEMAVIIVGFNYWITGRKSQAIKGWRYGDPYPRLISAVRYDDDA